MYPDRRGSGRRGRAYCLFSARRADPARRRVGLCLRGGTLALYFLFAESRVNFWTLPRWAPSGGRLYATLVGKTDNRPHDLRSWGISKRSEQVDRYPSMSDRLTDARRLVGYSATVCANIALASVGNSGHMMFYAYSQSLLTGGLPYGSPLAWRWGSQ